MKFGEVVKLGMDCGGTPQVKEGVNISIHNMKE